MKVSIGSIWTIRAHERIVQAQVISDKDAFVVVRILEGKHFGQTLKCQVILTYPCDGALCVDKVKLEDRDGPFWGCRVLSGVRAGRLFYTAPMLVELKPLKG